jgi:hypothetical protein
MRVRGRSGGCGGGGGGLLHRRLSAADNMGDVCVGDNIGSDGSGIVIGGSVGDVGIVGSGGGVGGGVDSGGGHGFARRGGERQRGQQLLRLPRELRHALADRPQTRPRDGIGINIEGGGEARVANFGAASFLPRLHRALSWP